MKRFSQLLIFSLFYIATCAQPTQVGKRPPIGGEIKREDFPQEIDKGPVNATFTFAIFSDLHLSDTLSQNSEDLQNAITEVNANKNLAFVLITGDITDNGDTKSLRLAKTLLNELKIPYYIIPGNHDTRISESGGSDFTSIFGDQHFRLFFNGYLFLGINSSPMLQLEDGHISPQELEWLAHQLKQVGRKQPVYILTHYPIKKGNIDNWDTLTDLVRKYNTQGIFGGHFHRNCVLSYDGIPGVVVRSTQRETDSIGGYTICSIGDSLYIAEKKIGATAHIWQALPLEKKVYTEGDHKAFPRPNFDVNKTYKNVKTVWEKKNEVEIDGTPVINQNSIFFGDANGTLHCITANKGKPVWQFKTTGNIYSTPAVSEGKIVFGSYDHNIYCLNTTDGKLLWKFATSQAVIASPIIENNIVYIGSSDGQFLAINLQSGQLIWAYKGIDSYVQTKAVINDNKVIFTAWDNHIYALNKETGALLWKWQSSTDKLKNTPAAIPPVLAHNKLFVTTNDHLITAIDVEHGTTIWEKKKHHIIHSTGVSTDQSTIFMRSTKDSVLAINAKSNIYAKRWIKNANYGEDLYACQMIPYNNQLVFSTKHGLICCLDEETGTLLWQHKINNTSLNIIPMAPNSWLITTRDGQIIRLNVK